MGYEARRSAGDGRGGRHHGEDRLSQAPRRSQGEVSAAEARLIELKTAGSGNWDAQKGGVETAWSELAKAFTKLELGEVNHVMDHRLILVLMWALGLVSSYTMGGFIHVLLILAVRCWWFAS